MKCLVFALTSLSCLRQLQGKSGPQLSGWGLRTQTESGRRWIELSCQVCEVGEKTWAALAGLWNPIYDAVLSKYKDTLWKIGLTQNKRTLGLKYKRLPFSPLSLDLISVEMVPLNVFLRRKRFWWEEAEASHLSKLRYSMKRGECEKEHENWGILAFPPNWVKSDQGKQRLQHCVHLH